MEGEFCPKGWKRTQVPKRTPLLEDTAASTRRSAAANLLRQTSHIFPHPLSCPHRRPLQPPGRPEHWLQPLQTTSSCTSSRLLLLCCGAGHPATETVNLGRKEGEERAWLLPPGRNRHVPCSTGSALLQVVPSHASANEWGAQSTLWGSGGDGPAAETRPPASQRAPSSCFRTCLHAPMGCR